MEIIDKKYKLEKIIQDGYSFDIGKYTSEAWDLFGRSAGQFILYALLVILINTMVPFAGIILGAVLTAGYFLGARKLEQKGKISLEDLFKSFDFFLPLFLAGLIGGILVTLGFFLLIIPGIWFAVAISFSYQLIVFEKLDFWESIETSVKIVNKKWFSFLLLWIVVIAINIVGLLFLGIGLLVTIPFTTLIFYSCYKDIVGLETSRTFDISDHMVED